MEYGTCTTAAASPPQSPLTLQGILDLKARIEALGPESIGEWMRRRGFPPESHVLVLPENVQTGLTQALGLLPLWPAYVKFSSLANEPMFVSRLRVWGDPA